MFARALHHKPILPEATGPVITSDQWARLRERAVSEKVAAPRRRGLNYNESVPHMDLGNKTPPEYLFLEISSPSAQDKKATKN
jgi:hypothetical protein